MSAKSADKKAWLEWQKRESRAYTTMLDLQRRLGEKQCQLAPLVFLKKPLTEFLRDIRMLATETHAAQDAWLAIVQEANK